MEFQIIHIDETDSTNRWLCNNLPLLRNNPALFQNNPALFQNNPALLNNKGSLLRESDCVVVVADYQTAGRGCGTNSWESERGKNLTFSMLIHPEEIPWGTVAPSERLSVKEQFHITEVVSVALCETLERYLHQKVEIKWPNDIYVGDRKICGILIENRLQGSVIKDSIIGIGLNVNQRQFVSDAPNPVSLYQLTGQETNLDELLNQFHAAFERISQSKTSCFDYRERLYRKGKDSLYEDKTSCFTARLTDVLPDGRLLLVDKEGRERLYAFKEVRFCL